MRKTWIPAVAFLIALAVLASPAYASSVHLKGGPKAEPNFTDNGLSVSASGDLSGLGNADVLITLTATGNPTALCTNPGDQSKVPGQNPAPITVSGTEAIPASEIKNGNTPFAVSTSGPATPVPGAPECPNSGWTEDITSLAFTSAVITVEQPPGTVVLTITCTISPPSSDGPVPASDVSCTIS